MNLSSSDEDDSCYSSNDDDITSLLQHGRQTHVTTTSGTATGKTAPNGDSSPSPRLEFTSAANEPIESSDEFEDVDWEDASFSNEEEDEQQQLVGLGKKLPAAVVSAPTGGSKITQSSHRKFPSRDVILHLDPTKARSHENQAMVSNDTKHGRSREKKDKGRRMNKIRNIPSHMQNFIQDLHKSHMLCMVSRGVFLSCGILGSIDEEIWSVAHSLIPAEFIFHTEEECSANGSLIRVPTWKTVRKFSLWFFDLVNNVEQRRRNAYASNIAAGAPIVRRRRTTNKRRKTIDSLNQQNGITPSSTVTATANNDANYWIQRLKDIIEYLSPIHDENPQHENALNIITISPLEKVILFICFTRSLKWRVRLVLSMEPMPREMTVDHPLFHTTMRSTFHHIVRSIEKNASTNRGKKRRRGRKPKMEDKESNFLSKPLSSMDVMSLPCTTSYSYQDFVWAEVLCEKKQVGNEEKVTASSGSHHRWVHVDPTCNLFDEPMKVELIDLQTYTIKQPNSRNKIVKPVSYVIGIEHFHDVAESDTSECTKQIRQSLLSTTKITDITPRYANRWSLTLRIRGANSKSVAQGKCSNDWWRQTLHRINHSFGRKRGEVNHSRSKSIRRNKGISSTSFKVETESRGDGKIDVLIIDDDDDADDEQSSSSKHQDMEQMEQLEFESRKEQEAIPTSKAAFKNHPLYVIPSVMKKQDVLAPDARKRICGMFKGEMVYKRSDVSTAVPAKKWLYLGRKVIEKELANPAKVVKARKKPTPKGFQALSTYGATRDKQEDALKDDNNPSRDSEGDANTKLYGIWQTVKWSPPPVAPNDPIPVNEHNNVELALLNPGLAHIELYRIAKVAKQLGIPYAPCLVGFEGHGGNRTPTIRGIVVHQHNIDLLQEAHVEMQSQLVENEVKERQQAIYGRWRRLIKGVLTKERLAREYAND